MKENNGMSLILGDKDLTWIRDSNTVEHPEHYTYGKIECIDFIYDKELNFSLGNAIKYIVRAGKKKSAGMNSSDKKIQDLEKAIQYLKFEIEREKGIR